MVWRTGVSGVPVTILEMSSLSNSRLKKTQKLFLTSRTRWSCYLAYWLESTGTSGVTMVSGRGVTARSWRSTSRLIVSDIGITLRWEERTGSSGVAVVVVVDASTWQWIMNKRRSQGCTKFVLKRETSPDNTGHNVSDRKILVILSQNGKYWSHYPRPENTRLQSC